MSPPLFLAIATAGRSLMVTLAGLEPATSPAPGEQGRSIPLELQRRHDLHDRLWRRRGGAIGSIPATPEQGDARAPLPAALDCVIPRNNGTQRWERYCWSKA